MNISDAVIHLARDSAELGDIAANYWCDQAQRCIGARGEFKVALSGGSTPRLLFERLAAPPYRDRIDWSRIRFFFGDERCVPRDHPDSNFRMARESLFDPLAIDDGQVFRVETERGPEGAALAYDELMRQAISDQGLDLVMLGLGPDGHIASLFPGTPALRERDKMVVPVYVEKFSSWRISITFPVLSAAVRIQLLAAGTGKADIVSRILDKGPRSREPYPVEMIQARQQIDLFLDRQAYQNLAQDC